MTDEQKTLMDDFAAALVKIQAATKTGGEATLTPQECSGLIFAIQQLRSFTALVPS